MVGGLAVFFILLMTLGHSAPSSARHGPATQLELQPRDIPIPEGIRQAGDVHPGQPQCFVYGGTKYCYMVGSGTPVIPPG
jgi:hypothetical protein